MQRDQAFCVAFDRIPSLGVATGVGVQAVTSQPPDLVPSGAGPAKERQRSPSQRVGECINRGHQGIQRVLGQVAGMVSGLRGASRAVSRSGRPGTSFQFQIPVSRYVQAQYAIAEPFQQSERTSKYVDPPPFIR